MKRRAFVRQGAVVGGAAMFGLERFPHALFAGAREKRAQDRVTLGRTGIQVSRLAQGTGTHGVNKSSNQTRLGLEGLADLLRAGVDRGLNFWDLAAQYGRHPSATRAWTPAS